LERYVRAIEVGRLARARIAQRAAELDKEGKGDQMAYLTHGSQGQLVQHPDLKTARDAEKDANDYGRELLLTPAARAKGGAEPAKATGGKFGGVFDGD
jgi:phage terminase small subunit